MVKARVATEPFLERQGIARTVNPLSPRLPSPVVFGSRVLSGKERVGIPVRTGAARSQKIMTDFLYDPSVCGSSEEPCRNVTQLRLAEDEIYRRTPAPASDSMDFEILEPAKRFLAYVPDWGHEEMLIPWRHGLSWRRKGRLKR